MYPYTTDGYDAMLDLAMDSFYITTLDDPKWYFREFDSKSNAVLWTKNIKRAREFHTKEDAMEVAVTTKREFLIEEVDEWCF